MSTKDFYFKDFTRETFDEMIATRKRRRKPRLRPRVYSFIRQRDKVCQGCGEPPGRHRLSIDFKDGDEQNLSYDNCVAHCSSCMPDGLPYRDF